MYVTKLFRCVAYEANCDELMLPLAFQGVANTMAPAAMAALAVATFAESGEPSVTGMRRTENPSCPSPLPNARVRSAAVMSPAQAA